MICFECQCFFNDGKSLLQHVFSHHGHMAQFRCTDCAKSFSAFSSFKNHMRLKHGNTPYSRASGSSGKRAVSRTSSNTPENITIGSSSTFSDDIPVSIDMNECIETTSLGYDSADDDSSDQIHLTAILRNMCTDTTDQAVTKETPNNTSLLKNQTLSFISKLYSFTEVSRKCVRDIISETSILCRSLLDSVRESISSTSNTQNPIPIDEILEAASDPFGTLSTEWQHLKIFHANGTLILPESHIIGERYEFKNVNDEQILTPVKVTIEFIPIRKVFVQFFQMSGVFQETLDYMKSLESDKNIISNFCQGNLWKAQSSLFEGKICLPLFMYFDDYETNNPLGSHKGISKCGAVYLSLPSLPPKYQSKLQNIFLFLLFNSLDRACFKNEVIFAKALEELRYLRETGITVNLPDGPVQIFFQLSLVLGDNLGIHSMLGFSESFNANLFCRFCLTHRKDIEKIFRDTQCNPRNVENYTRLLNLHDVSRSGIKEECVFHKNLGFHATINLCVDVMHDFLEGILPGDLALLLFYFIYVKKYFTLEELNTRTQALNYGTKNKPAEILPHHLKTSKRLAMSSAEMLSFVRHLCMIIGHLIPIDSEHWHQVKLLKSIIEILVSEVLPVEAANRLYGLITIYLESHVKLFPGTMKPKHHFIIHYKEVMLLVGVLWKISSMRYEGKHQEGKVIARSAISRVNVCHSIAFRHQLLLNHRFISHSSSDFTIEHGVIRTAKFVDLLVEVPSPGCLPTNLDNPIQIVSWMKFQGKTVTKDTIIMIPCEEGPTFYEVRLILLHTQEQVSIVTKNLQGCYFDEQTQSYKILHPDSVSWTCLRYADLRNSIFSRKNRLSDGYTYITKLWM